jgi:uncharacterized protein (DUF2141 family)
VLLILGAAACAGTTMLLDKGPGTAELGIEVRDIEHREGRIRIAIFATPEGFPDQPEEAERVNTMEIEGDSLRWEVKDLPTGLWAIAVLHDENGDGEMQTDWLGRPSEGWGVSRDAKASFGPPSFEDSAIELGPQGAETIIHLRY